MVSGFGFMVLGLGLGWGGHKIRRTYTDVVSTCPVNEPWGKGHFYDVEV